MDYQFGFPIVNVENIFEVLAGLGIRAWQHTQPATSLADYLQGDLSPDQRAELRFAPKAEVVFLRDHHENPFRGFRSVNKDWATIFTILPGGLIPIVGEYKHGVDEVVLVPPSGVPHTDDLATTNPMAACARREWEEETGVPLTRVEALSDHPLAVSGRQSTARFYPFWGEVQEPIIKGPAKLDATERLKMVLVPLPEWLKLMQRGKGIEDCAVSVTLLALQRLGKVMV